MSAQRRPKETVRTNIVTSMSTLIYTSFVERGFTRKQFIPVKDLINDPRDPYIVAFESEGKVLPKWSTFSPMAVTMETLNKQEVLYALTIRGRVSSVEKPSTIVGRAHVIGREGSTSLANLLKNRSKGWVEMMVWNFADAVAEMCTVWAERVHASVEVAVDADTSSYHRAYRYVILGDGFIVGR